MPLYLEDLASERKSVKVEDGGHTVNVEYNPNDMNAGTIRRFNAIQRKIREETAEEDDLDWLFQTAELIVVGWDLFENQAAEKRGEKWDITAEHLAVLPLSLVAKMVQEVFADMTPDTDPNASGANSDATSESPRSSPRPLKKR